MRKRYKGKFQYDKKLLNPLIDEILKIFTFGFLVLLVLSLYRTQEIGYTIKDDIQIIAVLLVFILYLFRYKISSFSKYIYLIIITFVLGLIGVYSLGMFAGSIFFFPMIIVLLALFYSKKVVQIFTFLSMLFFIYIAYLFVLGDGIKQIDSNLILTSAKHWTVYLSSIFLFFILTGTVIIKYRTTIDELILEIDNQKKDIEKLANYDYLTQLPNHNLLKEYFYKMSAHAKRNSSKLGVAFADLDGFKLINDEYGHDAGDYCLKVIASRLESAIRRSDIAARIGGDEFILLFDDISDKEVISIILAKLIKKINEPINFSGKELNVGISFGVSFYPDDGTDFNKLKKHADTAMYKVKNEDKNSYCIYNK